MAALGRSYFLPALLTVACQVLAPAQAPPASPARFAVVLDAGHGGNDTGAVITGQSGAVEEKAYTLALSVRLRSLLAARGMTVVTTREADAALDPGRRAEIANHAAAQVCLSLHAAMTGTGVHLFISSLSPASAEHFIPWKTAQAAWVPRSLALAGVLNSALQHAGIPVTVGRSALTTIDSMTCPAVAIEVAAQNTSDKASDDNASAPMDGAAYQIKIANALAAALVEWRSEGAHLEGQPFGSQVP